MVILFIHIIFPVHMATNEKQKSHFSSHKSYYILMKWPTFFYIYMHWITLKNLYNLLRLNWVNFGSFHTIVWSLGLSVKRVLDGLLLCQKSWMSLGLPVTLGDIPRSLHPPASESVLTSSEADFSDSCQCLSGWLHQLPHLLLGLFLLGSGYEHLLLELV